MNVQRSLHLQYHDRGALEQGTEPQLLPGRRSINGCPLLRVCVHGVCVHLDGLFAEQNMGNHTWPYVTSVFIYMRLVLMIALFFICICLRMRSLVSASSSSVFLIDTF